MFNPGMIIAGRYEILDVVGSGGMSVVYKAKCHKLNRYVAIKVLKPEFSDDKNFVSKFRGEAQSAAGLTHPNIVNVYDVGEDNGIYFIVMELVEGITLKEYIQVNGRLSVDKAIDFAIQIASGIEIAHENHTIHRDIKPQNIIVAKNGMVKVTDFGIARAATSNTVGANAMGSVHYISPEQARGGYSDEKSDIYSFGITLYEMVTGRVPFEGENNVTIALMHIQETIIPPREYYPDIPASLEKIILKCTQKKPERRYLTASALIADLKRAQLNPNADLLTSAAAVAAGQTVVMSDDELKAIKNGIIEDNEPEDDLNLDSMMEDDSFEDDYEDDYEDVDISSREEDEDEDTEELEDEDDMDMDPKLIKIITIGGIVAAIVLAILALVMIGSFSGWFKFGDKDKTTTEEASGSIEMIDVVGLSVEDCEKKLAKAGFEKDAYEIVYKMSDTIESDVVMEQSVDKGDMVAKDEKVTITVSSGKEEVTVPNVEGYEDAQAIKALEENGLSYTHAYEYSDDVDKDKVIKQSPAAGEKVAKGTKITITISNGKEVTESTVPSLTGLTLTEAESTLNGAGLKLGTTTQEYSDSYATGQVIHQSISANSTVEGGTAVDITLSKGPKQTEAKKTSYTVTFSGKVSANGYTFAEGEEVTVHVVYKQGNASYDVLKDTYGASNFPVDMGSVTGITGLASNSGEVTVSITKADGTDITNSGFSNQVSPSYEKVTE